MCPDCRPIQTGQAGGTTYLFIRGGGSDANKVLIDGIPINDIGGDVEFANVASAADSQVEVLRGPNSALYGSDALAGVVSLRLPEEAPAPSIHVRDRGRQLRHLSPGRRDKRSIQKIRLLADYSRFESSNAIRG